MSKAYLGLSRLSGHRMQVCLFVWDSSSLIDWRNQMSNNVIYFSFLFYPGTSGQTLSSQCFSDHRAKGKAKDSIKIRAAPSCVCVLSIRLCQGVKKGICWSIQLDFVVSSDYKESPSNCKKVVDFWVMVVHPMHLCFGHQACIMHLPRLNSQVNLLQPRYDLSVPMQWKAFDHCCVSYALVVTPPPLRVLQYIGWCRTASDVTCLCRRQSGRIKLQVGDFLGLTL